MSNYYEVKVDGVSIHDPAYKEMTLLNAVVHGALGEAGSFEFTMAKGHVFYNAITPYKSDIEVFEDGDCIFFGRVSHIDVDIYKRKTLHCEGALAFLNDVVLPPDVTGLYAPMPTTEYFRFIINYYNSYVDNNRKLYIATPPSDDNLPCTHKWSYKTAKEEIQNEVLKYSGGYLYTLRDDGRTYVYWAIKDPLASADPQPITLGVNLLDVVNKSQPYYTAAIATGAEVEGQDGKSEIVRMQTPVQLSNVSQYGFMCKYLEFPDCVTVSALEEMCADWLAYSNWGGLTFELDAADMHLFNGTYPRIILGNSVILGGVSTASRELVVSALETDINTGRKRVTVGLDVIQPMSRRVADNSQQDGGGGGNDWDNDWEDDNGGGSGYDPVIHDPDGNAYVPYYDPDDDTVKVVKIPQYIYFSTVYDHLYEAGDTLSISNYAVSAVYGDQSETVITSSCTFNPSNGYEFVDGVNPVSLVATYVVGGRTYQATCTLYSDSNLPTSITISRPPKKTIYTAGETIDLTGIYVIAHLSDDTQWVHPDTKFGNIPVNELTADPSTAGGGSSVAHSSIYAEGYEIVYDYGSQIGFGADLSGDWYVNIGNATYSTNNPYDTENPHTIPCDYYVWKQVTFYAGVASEYDELAMFTKQPYSNWLQYNISDGIDSFFSHYYLLKNNTLYPLDTVFDKAAIKQRAVNFFGQEYLYHFYNQVKKGSISGSGWMQNGTSKRNNFNSSSDMLTIPFLRDIVASNEITVKWERPVDNRELTATFDITV